MADSPPLTDYERQRLERIKRNQEKLMSFELPNLAAAAAASNQSISKRTRSETNKIPKEKKPKSDETPIVLRRSLRTRGISPDSTEKEESSGVGDAEEDKDLVSGTIKIPKEKKHRSDQTVIQRFLRTRRIPQYASTKQGSTATTTTTAAAAAQLESPAPVVSMRDAFVMSKVNNNSQHQKQQHLIHTIKGLSKKTTISSMKCSIDSTSLILKSENIAKLMTGGIMNLSFFPSNDGSLLVAGDKNGNVAFWDVDRHLKNGEEEIDDIYLYDPHTSPVSGITIRPSLLSKVYTSSYDGCIRMLDVVKESFDLVYSSEDAIFCLSHQPHEAKSLYFSEAKGVINVWDERAGKSSSSWRLHYERVNTIDFHPENTNLMATSSTYGTARIWDLRRINAKKPITLKVVDHKKAVHSAYFSPSGNCLATTSVSNEVGLHEGANFMYTCMISHDNQVGRFVSPFRAIWGWDDSCLFIGNMDRGVDIIPTREEEMVTLESPQIPYRFAAHPYKFGMLAGATEGGQVYVWVSQ